MMEKNLNMMITVDDGSRRVPIQNKDGVEIGAFTFRPTDVGIVERYNRMAETFDGVTAPLDALEADESGELDLTDPKVREALNEAEGRLYAAVNTLLDSDGAAAAFFGHMSPFSPVDGEFYCVSVLQALGAFINAQFERETVSLSAKAQSYLKKAKKK